MNSTTLKALTRHGESLIAAFPNCTEKDPIALCKKLRRIETSLTKPLTDYCNTGDDSKLDEVIHKAMHKVEAILFADGVSNNGRECGLFINQDVRGYALKLDDTWTREWNFKRHADGKLVIREHRIQTDMGGYGILAPDLTA